MSRVPTRVVDREYRAEVAAVIVTYHPDLERLLESLDSLLPQVSEIVLVDNGSDNVSHLVSLATRRASATLLPLGENVGVATALNIAVDRLFQRSSCQWVLLLDQDSVVLPDAVKTTFIKFGALEPSERRRCGVVALSGSSSAPRSWVWRRVQRGRVIKTLGDFYVCRDVITSGSMIRREILEALRFREDLFIDQVDTEHCRRVVSAGWIVLETRSALLDHRLGERFVARSGPRTYESGQRLYYICRNSVVLCLQRQKSPFEAMLLVVGLARSYAVRHGVRCVPRLVAILGLGVLDAVLHRMGRREYAFIRRLDRLPGEELRRSHAGASGRV